MPIGQVTLSTVAAPVPVIGDEELAAGIKTHFNSLDGPQAEIQDEFGDLVRRRRVTQLLTLRRVWADCSLEKQIRRG
jgi:hypothetical protein